MRRMRRGPPDCGQLRHLASSRAGAPRQESSTRLASAQNSSHGRHRLERRQQMNAVKRVEEMRRRWGAEPSDFALRRDQGERMTEVALAHSEQLRELVVAMIAYRMVENTKYYHRRHFSSSMSTSRY